MYGSAIAGNCEVFRRDDTALNGRKNSNKIKELLQPFFKVKQDILAIHDAINKFLSDQRFTFRSFLSLTFWFFGFFTVPGSREKFVTAVTVSFRGSPETIHEIEIRAKRRQ